MEDTGLIFTFGVEQSFFISSFFSYWLMPRFYSGVFLFYSLCGIEFQRFLENIFGEVKYIYVYLTYEKTNYNPHSKHN